MLRNAIEKFSEGRTAHHTCILAGSAFATVVGAAAAAAAAPVACGNCRRFVVHNCILIHHGRRIHRRRFVTVKGHNAATAFAPSAVHAG